MGFVEGGFESHDEATVMSRCGFVIPRFGMEFEEGFLLPFPVEEDGFGDGVGETPSEEDPSLVLLPVGEVVVGLRDFFTVVEEVGHGEVWRVGVSPALGFEW